MKRLIYSFLMVLLAGVLVDIQPVMALTDAELEALEKQIEEKEQASKRQAEEAARKQEETRRKAEAKKRAEAEARKKAEEERLRRESEQREADLEQQQADLEEQREQEERMRLEMEQRKAEETARQAELERIRQEEEARIRAEVERKQQYDTLHSRANAHMDKSEFDQAIEIYRQVLVSFPEDEIARRGIDEAKNLQKVCKGLLGNWQLSHGPSWVVHDNKTVDGAWLIFTAVGEWECVDAKKREFRVSWPDFGWIDYLILSEDENSLSPSRDTPFSGIRMIGGQPADKSRTRPSL